MKLTIISPEKVVYEGKAERVSVPGSMCPFEILEGHAPIISSLQEGEITFKGDGSQTVPIKGGFVEVSENSVVACVELKQAKS